VIHRCGCVSPLVLYRTWTCCPFLECSFRVRNVAHVFGLPKKTSVFAPFGFARCCVFKISDEASLVLSWNHVSPYFVAFNSNQLQDTLQGSKMENMVTATQAAKKIGCSEATVSRWATKLGFCTRFGRSRVLTPKQVATISKEWKKSTGNPNFRKKTTT